METILDGVIIDSIRHAYFNTWFLTKGEDIGGRDTFNAYCFADGELDCLVAGVDLNTAQTAIDLDMVGQYDNAKKRLGVK